MLWYFSQRIPSLVNFSIDPYSEGEVAAQAGTIHTCFRTEHSVIYCRAKAMCVISRGRGVCLVAAQIFNVRHRLCGKAMADPVIPSSKKHVAPSF